MNLDEFNDAVDPDLPNYISFWWSGVKYAALLSEKPVEFDDAENAYVWASWSDKNFVHAERRVPVRNVFGVLADKRNRR